MKRIIHIRRRNFFHAFQCLNTALRLFGFGGFGFETVDITLQVIDFQLLLTIHGILLCQFSRPLQFKGRIIARVFIEFLLFNMQNFADNRI